MLNIMILGCGYVGLTDSIMMSYLGHNVTCLDIDQSKIESITHGKIPFFEANLEEYLHKVTASKQNTLKAYTVEEFTKKMLPNGNSKISGFDAVFLAVGTPSALDGSADMTYIYSAIDWVAANVDPSALVVIKSTVPPGTSANIQKYIDEKNTGHRIATNPEFLREGNAVHDFLSPDRIVIGTQNIKDIDVFHLLYASLTKSGVKLISTDLTSSELIKYASNTFLANKIALINEMSDLCEKIGANAEDVSLAVGMDKRIGDRFLKIGPGFGGSCFPKDILALQYIINECEGRSHLLDAIIESNSLRPKKMTELIGAIIGEIKGKKIAIMGLTFKAETDDMRSSPSLEIIREIKLQGGIISAYDPMGQMHARDYLNEEEVANSPLIAAEQAEAIVVLTEWKEFKNLDLHDIKKVINKPIIIDLRRYLDRKKVEKSGFKYYTIGEKLKIST